MLAGNLETGTKPCLYVTCVLPVACLSHTARAGLQVPSPAARRADPPGAPSPVLCRGSHRLVLSGCPLGQQTGPTGTDGQAQLLPCSCRPQGRSRGMGCAAGHGGTGHSQSTRCRRASSQSELRAHSLQALISHSENN